MKANLFYIFFLMIFSVEIHAQVYQPIDTADFAERKMFSESYKMVNENYQKYLKLKYAGSTGKELSKNYNDFQEKFRKEIKNKDYIFKSKFTEQLNIYFQKLRSETGAKDIKLLIAKDNTPNAFCVQDGVFVANMGLFNWLDNEEQITAVLAHELGHKIFQHSENWQKSRLENEKNSKVKVLEISQTKINKTEKAFELFKSQIYESTALRRKNESAADSIGYIMFAKTGAKKTEYINALRNLQKFDSISPKTVTVETYRKLYDLPDQPFKEKWLKKEDFSGYNYDHYKERMNKDSLSTHPEIEARITYLKKNFPELSKEELPVESKNAAFLDLKKSARFEILPNYYHSEDYGLGIYTAMQFLQENEAEVYYKNWLGKNFQKIYEARKNYNLNRYLDRADPKNQSESYLQFLSFMWNLSMEDIKKISEFYLKN